MFKKSILIVEDNKTEMDEYIKMANVLNIEYHTSQSYDEAIRFIKKHSISYALIDIHLSSGADGAKSLEGVEVVKYLKANNPETIAIVMSGDSRVASFDAALKAGACHYIKKPILNTEEFKIALKMADDKYRLKTAKKMAYSSHPELEKYPDGLILDEGTKQMARNVAKIKVLPCTIFGETGTGKEELTKFIHRTREESEGPVPFVAVNCANLTSDHAVTALFGHVKGAFTGAHQNRVGYIGEANGGILFLDEVQFLSIDCQRRLLRVLNDGSYERLGDGKTLYSKFQVIVATTANLDNMAAKHQFLLDLRTRLTGVDIVLQPLRERKNDFYPLIDFLLLKKGVKISEETKLAIVDKCKTYYWQGNIRLLYNAISTFISLAQLNETPLEPNNLPVYPTMLPPSDATKASATSIKHHDQIKSDNKPNINSTNKYLREVYEKVGRLPYEDIPLQELIETLEKAAIQIKREAYGCPKSIIESLNVPRATLRRKLIKYRISIPDRGSPQNLLRRQKY